MEKEIFVSAPGKIILFGEHAVVYGRTAIAGSIDLRTYASLEPFENEKIGLFLPDLKVEKFWNGHNLIEAVSKHTSIDSDEPPPLEAILPIARQLSDCSEDAPDVEHLAILVFWYLLIGISQRKKRDFSGFKVTVRSKLPTGVGLGSSGAYCVCIATTLLQFAGVITAPTLQAESGLTWDASDLEIIRKWSAAADVIIHGKASGLDAAVCTYGGIAKFSLDTPIEPLKKYGF